MGMLLAAGRHGKLYRIVRRQATNLKPASDNFYYLAMG
jgi:hypothetical protein